MLDGKSSPVYFTPDSSVFNDPDFPVPNFFYNDVLSITVNSSILVTLRKGETSKAVIANPTRFRLYDDFLVYPGEHILIKKGIYNDFTFETDGNLQRNNELLFFKTFHQLIKYPVLPNINNPSIDTILFLEKRLKNEIPIFKSAAQKIFDSLVTIYNVSNKFKKETRNYVSYKYLIMELYLYKQYKDSLQAHGLYMGKLKQLLLPINRLYEKDKFVESIGELNDLADQILPYIKWKIRTEDEFRSCFDSVETNFKALPKDYLLSQLMFYAYKRRIQIPEGYLKKYDHSCTDKVYKKLIHNLIFQQQNSDKKASEISTNSLLAINGKKVKSLEQVLNQNKGKLIVLDFWASWCSPCLKEIPYLKNIIKEYPESNVVFIGISLDMGIQFWQKSVIANGVNTKNNFLLINPKTSAFVERYNINTIPRVILIDKNGKLIDSNAPSPSSPDLKPLLDKLIKE